MLADDDLGLLEALLTIDSADSDAVSLPDTIVQPRARFAHPPGFIQIKSEMVEPTVKSEAGIRSAGVKRSAPSGTVQRPNRRRLSNMEANEHLFGHPPCCEDDESDQDVDPKLEDAERPEVG